MRLRSVILATLLLATPAFATPRLHAVFSPHAVLQRDLPLRIFGTASPGESLEVTLATRAAKTIADRDGNWSVTLDALPAGGPYVLTASGEGKAVAEDILVGEVFLASGQSNMQFTMAPQPPWTEGVVDFESEIAAADHPSIRFISAPTTFATTPASDVSAAWTVCSPLTAGKYSAVAYYFACKLQSELKVPVGIVSSAVGSTPAEAWVDRDTLANSPVFRDVIGGHEKKVAAYPDRLKAYEQALADWEQRNGSANEKPKSPDDPNHSVYAPFLLYNGMIAPYTRATIRGFIWYQGESNTARAANYVELMTLLITDWRKKFGRADMPFYQVQLAAYQTPATQPTDTPWSHLREAQRIIPSRVPHSATAVAIDVGDQKRIHPRDKKTVGERLALLALHHTFGNTALVASGPAFSGVTIEGNTLRLRFDPATGPLDLRGSTGFTLAGADKVFHPATARLEADTIVVSSPNVPNPLAARYAREDFPFPVLYNAANLPASPFRTDDW